MNYIEKIGILLSNKYKKIKKNFSSKKKIENPLLETPLTYESNNYSELNLSLSEKIALEKRRRHQAYSSLDYFLSNLSYFDFFSLDSLEILRKARLSTQLFKKPLVSSEFLLLAFFSTNLKYSPILETPKLELCTFLNQYNINEGEIFKKINDSILLERKRTLSSLRNFWFNLNNPFLSKIFSRRKTPKISPEVNIIFEKAAENALQRFKTPVISSEILFITIMESKNTKAGKILRQQFKNDLDWHTLRYGLIKRLHSEEFTIREDVIKNQQYFAYLLKAGLSEFEFANLLDRDCLSAGVSLYRDLILEKVLAINIYKVLKKEIKTSIKKKSIRKYTK